MKRKEIISNCHRSSGRKNETNNVPGASDDSEQDSSTSKYVVEEDHRKRKDGPGGD